MEQVPEAPTKALTFVEDLPEDEQDVEGYSKYGAGMLQDRILACKCTSLLAATWLKGTF